MKTEMVFKYYVTYVLQRWLPYKQEGCKVHTCITNKVKVKCIKTEQKIEYNSRLEPSTLPRDDGKRPDGLNTAPWKEGRCLVWDFTCPDTLAASHLDRAVSGPGAVATEAEARKRSKYSSLAATYYFVPVAVETLGALGQEAAQFISDLGRRITATTGQPRSVAFLFQRLSVAIQRGNAASVT